MPLHKDFGSRRLNTAATGSFELAIVEHASAPVAGGYNPYDTFPSVGRKNGTQEHADLRRLSEWIRLKRQVAQIKKSGNT
jgi:hypothetical protein